MAALDLLAALGTPTFVAGIALLMLVDTLPLVGLAIPGDIAVVTAAASRSPAAAAGTFAGVVGGTIAGWSLCFALGRSMSNRLHRGRLGRWVGETRWAAAEQLLRGGGGRVLMLVQFLPVFNTLVPMVAGTLHMPYRRFIRYATIGSSAWALLYVAVGVGARSGGELLFDTSNPLVGLALFGAPGVIVGWTVLALVRRRLRLGLPVLATAAQIAEPVRPLRSRVRARRFAATMAMAERTRPWPAKPPGRSTGRSSTRTALPR